MTNLDLRSDYFEFIKTTFAQLTPHAEVWLYGSRVKGTSQKTSDLDCVVFLQKDEKKKKHLLRELFEDSNLPFRIDLFVWEDIPSNFHDSIKECHFVLQKKSN